MHSPIGDLTISIANEALVSIDWGWARDQKPIKLLEDAKSQLDDYFDGYRKTFDLPLAPAGTEYQKRVWSQIYKIPYGKTLSYAKLASALKTSPRPVGMACGANPIPIIIPCHRVLATAGMGGYSGDGGVETKVALLHLEGAVL